MIELRPTTKADVEEYFAEPLPWRIRAMTAVQDGRIVGVAGVSFLPDGTIAAFLQADDEVRRHPVTLHKAALAFLNGLSGRGRVVAMADADIEPAERWLRRLGFVRVPGDDPVYVLERR